jgi:PPM family protein phosphatase
MVSELPSQDKEPLPQHIGIFTRPSDSHPNWNEDSNCHFKNIGFAVLDGVGGIISGEKASSTARDFLYNEFKKIPAGLSITDAQDTMADILKRADTYVISEAGEINKQMATTAAVVWRERTQDDRWNIIIGNVGDSRVYFYRRNGNINQVTIDDNPFLRLYPVENTDELREVQKELNNTTDPSTLPEEKAKIFNNRFMIGQAIGWGDIDPSVIYASDINSETRILVLSDGISDNLTDDQIKKILDDTPDNVKAAQQLLEAAVICSQSTSARAKPDDMTVIVLGGHGEPQSKKVSPPKYPSRYIPEALANAHSMTDLFDVLIRTNGMAGTEGKIINPLELCEMIRNIYMHRVDINQLPQDGGLQNAVQRILNQTSK